MLGCLIYQFKTIWKLTAGFEHLQSQVILFIGHGCEELSLGNDDAAGALTQGVVPADQVSFHEEVLAQSRSSIDAYVEHLVAEVE